jgi:DNA-binding LacI/PurR family transcriptional regulator
VVPREWIDALRSDGRSPATIKDVARLAGVSRSTVSNVIRGSSTVADDLRARVMAVIAETNYRPDARARALRERTTGMIALITADTGNPFYASLGLGVEEAATLGEPLMIVANSHCDPAAELALCDSLISRLVDGVIVGDLSSNAGYPSILADNGIPVVLAGCGVSGDPRIGAVDTDDEQAMELIIDHLFALGHRTVCFAGPVDQRAAADRRRLAVRTAAAGRGIVLQEDHPDGATALICHNDLIAIDNLDALERAGWLVPDDVSVVGFDDTPLAAHRRISLTSVRCDAVALGRIAATQIFAAIAERRHATERQLLECELVVRGTTGPTTPGHPSLGAGWRPVHVLDTALERTPH